LRAGEALGDCSTEFGVVKVAVAPMVMALSVGCT
jgi:hypothetical protein